jgi:hypothetical protein
MSAQASDHGRLGFGSTETTCRADRPLIAEDGSVIEEEGGKRLQWLEILFDAIPADDRTARDRDQRLPVA